MLNYLLVNDIVKYHDGKCIRIIWIESDNSHCFTIKLYIDKLEINLIKLDDILDDIENNQAELIEDNYINTKAGIELSNKQRELLNKAQNIVELIFAPKNEPQCYLKKLRRLVEEASQRYNVSYKTVYKYIRKYLQGGKVIYALINNYSNCGGKGKRKKVGNVKRGRHSYLSMVTGKDFGINVDDEIEKYFNIALSRYYLNSKQRSIVKTYNLILKDFFTYQEMEGNQMVIKIKDKNQIPSLGQFKYWFYKHKKTDDMLSKRIGQTKFDLNYRRLNSDSLYETSGPGVRYQIDATIADVYLVNRIDRKSVIGRPVIYLVIDVFSRIIAGINVSLEGPSWNGASTALYNCIEDKVQYCSKFGINISPDDWNVKGVPQILIADRGEMVGPIVENVIKNLKIAIENTPSYMGCAKGIVEQYFHVMNTEIKHWLPGEVKKNYRERGERDNRMDAKLDIIEFTKIIILAVLKRNKTLMDNYPLTKEMIDDGVKPIPIGIWNWGIKNRSGNLRSLPKKVLIINLLKKGRAVIRRDGISFNGALYSCLKAEEQKWFLNAQIRGVKGVEIRYDDRNITNIYMILPDNDFIPLEMIKTKTSNAIFESKTLQEVVDYNYNRKVLKSELTNDMNQLTVDMNTEIENIINEAEDKGKGEKNIIKNVRENRSKENGWYRKEQALINRDEEFISNSVIEESDFNIENENNIIFKKIKAIKEKGKSSEK